jgi:hypothetical protein
MSLDLTGQIVMNAIPISQSYRSPIFEALALQTIIGVVALMILDGGGIAQICGIALLAFWSGVATLIVRHPQNPTATDLSAIRIGYIAVVAITPFIAGAVWALRGL